MIDYIEYDEIGMKEVRCMNCKTPVAGRTYIELPDREHIGKKVKVLTLKKYANYRQVKFNLSDGSYMEPIVCVACEKIDMDETAIMAQVNKGWELSMKDKGMPSDKIKELLGKKAGLKIEARAR